MLLGVLRAALSLSKKARDRGGGPTASSDLPDVRVGSRGGLRAEYRCRRMTALLLPDTGSEYDLLIAQTRQRGDLVPRG
jgi:hypothetical protein